MSRGRRIIIAVTAACICVLFVILFLKASLGKRRDDPVVLPEINTGEIGEQREEPAIPEYDGETAVEVNGNVPYFEKPESVQESYLHLSEPDGLGRCGPAEAVLGEDLFPKGSRGSIGQIRPTGWQTVRYDDLIEDRYLYNRCHLIGWQLAGNNDPRQLITGTRHMNVSGMLIYENRIADYIRTTGNHVRYRASPYFREDELVCRGVLLEAYSIEDHGEGICFCIFCHNVQPGIIIDYRTGESRRAP